MQITFYKYQATGNDFIIIDNRSNLFDKNNTKLIEKLCDRRFGIGADGLILIELEKNCDFKMIYFNSDGHQSTMCGNGGRCVVAFAKKIDLIKSEAFFLAIDGHHHAKIEGSFIELKMKNVTELKKIGDDYLLDTGSPHYVSFKSNVSEIDVNTAGAQIRNRKIFKENGVNVNFVEQKSENNFFVRTYERGVESETLSCGTGATAVAIAMHVSKKTSMNKIIINTQGGVLRVNFSINKSHYTDVWLCGPAKYVYQGTLNKNFNI